MNTILFYDTETSGFPLWDQPSDDPRQPHIVQMAGILANADTREEISSFDLIALPAGWTIPQDVAEIHGVTTDFALTVGVSEKLLVANLMHLWQASSRRVAHNESFDARMVRIGIKRFSVGSPETPDEWKNGEAECTASMSTPILDLPPTEAMRATGRNFPKKPKLTEAYEFFFGKPLEGAHSAMADARACMEVYWAIMDRGA